MLAIPSTFQRQPHPNVRHSPSRACS